jgi:hypothetical protein
VQKITQKYNECRFAVGKEKEPSVQGKDSNTQEKTGSYKTLI